MAFPSNPVNGQTTNINNVYYTYYSSIPGWSVTASFNDDISAANVNVSNQVTTSALVASSIAGTITTAAQNNITSVGTLTSLNSGAISSSGNVTGANLNTTGVVSTTGNVFAGNVDVSSVLYVGGIFNVSGNVIAHANVRVGNLISNSLVYGGNLYATNDINCEESIYATANITGATLNATTATIGGLGLSGNTIVSAGPTLTIDPNGTGGVDGNVVIAGNLQVQGNVTYINSNVVTITDLLINVANNAATAAEANGGGLAVGPAGAEYASLTYNSTSNTWVISNGANVSGTLTATGAITGTSFTGSGAGLTSIPGANVTGTVANATTATNATTASTALAVAAGNITGTTLNSSVVTSSLTTVGALDSGSITSGFGAIDIGVDTVTCGGIVNANANGVGNIGSSTTYFNTVFAKATSAQYADLAEVYAADDDYAPGTVVVFGGEKEITTTTLSHDSRVAGVISTDPAYLMNSKAEGLPVAFTGRVPCQVRGPIGKGDLVVTSEIPGVAQRLVDWIPGIVIGKSLGTIEDNSITMIEVVVGRF